MLEETACNFATGDCVTGLWFCTRSWVASSTFGSVVLPYLGREDDGAESVATAPDFLVSVGSVVFAQLQVHVYLIYSPSAACCCCKYESKNEKQSSINMVKAQMKLIS